VPIQVGDLVHLYGKIHSVHGFGIVVKTYKKAGITYAVIRWTKTAKEMTLDVGFLMKYGENRR